MTGVRQPIGLGILALALVVALSACGSSKKDSTAGSSSAQSTLALTISEQGKTVKFTVPKGAKGGLTTVKVTNRGKAPHGAQLLQLKGGHTPKDVMKALAPDNHAPNEWLRAAGGIGQVAPGATASATVSLEPGHYIVTDITADGPPAYAQFDLAAGKSGSLPGTATTVTAAAAGKDKYRWDISGPLKSGQSSVTFESKGKKALHFIQAVRVVGKVSKGQVLKALGKQGKPPKFIDQKTFYSSAILDGGKSEVTPVNFAKPGRWLLFCALNDRGEKKEHFKEGLVKFVDVK